jgi:hypothetical protein
MQSISFQFPARFLKPSARLNPVKSHLRLQARYQVRPPGGSLPQSIRPKRGLLPSQFSSPRFFQWTLAAGQVRWRE